MYYIGGRHLHDHKKVAIILAINSLLIVLLIMVIVIVALMKCRYKLHFGNYSELKSIQIPVYEIPTLLSCP